MNPIERALRALDGLQQRHRVPAFVVGVLKKFGDDSAGSLAAQLAFYGFLAMFPLLLIMITVLGLIATPGVRSSLVHSALSQFPVVGDQLTAPNGVTSLHAGSVAGLVVGIIGLVWGSLGVTQVAQRAMAEVWNVPGTVRPGFFPRLARSFAFLSVLGLNVVMLALLGTFGTFGSHGSLAKALLFLATLAVDMVLYVIGFRVLTPSAIETRVLVPGALMAAVGWAALQYLGTWLVGHQLKHSSQIYGYFASVLGLLGFIFLASRITLYAAEANVVWARRLYPRSIIQPPLTEADIQVLTDIAKAAERRPEQEVIVEYPGVKKRGRSRFARPRRGLGRFIQSGRGGDPSQRSATR